VRASVNTAAAAIMAIANGEPAEAEQKQLPPRRTLATPRPAGLK